MLQNFNRGDRVVLISSPYMPSDSNPYWDTTRMAGTIIDIVYDTPLYVVSPSVYGSGNYPQIIRVMVEWDNGMMVKYENDSTLKLLTEIIDEEKKKAENETPKSLNLDFSPLSRLIIAPEAKEEIVSVLKQHEHSQKIFMEWGLGDVIEYGRGMSFLFYGPPGTGKTWAAHCIAKSLGKELLILSAGEIQSSEPGAANRNIEQAFRSAKGSKKVLFMDECDSIISSRDGVGMVLGSEINTLLTEIEKFEGVCILATNRIEELDEALERRISLILEFPEPNYEQRNGIWERMLPKKMPLGKDVTVEILSEHKLTGGQIKNVVLQAARLALANDAKKVELEHFESAIARVQKSKSLMGTASRYRQIMVKEMTGMDVRKGKKRHSDYDIDTKSTGTHLS